MNVKNLLLVTLAALSATAGVTQAKHRRHHGPRMSFGFSVGTPVVAAPVVYPVSYAQPRCACRPAYYYHAPIVRVRPHLGFSFGSGNVGFGFSI